MAERYYRLDEAGAPVVVDNAESWWIWMNTHRSMIGVALDKVGAVRISTIFTGVDRDGFEPPLIYQTQVDKGQFDGELTRYSDRDAALLGHRQVVARVRAAEGENGGNGCHPN